MPGPYPVQSQITITASFLSPTNGALIDPTNVMITLTPPNGTPVTDQYPNGGIIRNGVGSYSWVYLVQETGGHVYKWQGTGAVIAASDYTFFTGV